MIISIKDSFTIHNHQWQPPFSWSKILMEYYVCVLITGVLTELPLRTITLFLLLVKCLTELGKQSTSPNLTSEMVTISFGSCRGKNGKQPSAADMDSMNIKLCLLVFAMPPAPFNTLSM